MESIKKDGDAVENETGDLLTDDKYLIVGDVSTDEKYLILEDPRFSDFKDKDPWVALNQWEGSFDDLRPFLQAKFDEIFSFEYNYYLEETLDSYYVHVNPMRWYGFSSSEEKHLDLESDKFPLYFETLVQSLIDQHEQICEYKDNDNPGIVNIKSMSISRLPYDTVVKIMNMVDELREEKSKKIKAISDYQYEQYIEYNEFLEGYLYFVVDNI